MKQFSIAVLSFLSDFGTESLIPTAPWLIWRKRTLQVGSCNVNLVRVLTFSCSLLETPAATSVQVCHVDFEKWAESTCLETGCLVLS